ncbi:MAG: PBP1A family penicillin-binding protein, partial [Marinovum algicola]
MTNNRHAGIFELLKEKEHFSSEFEDMPTAARGQAAVPTRGKALLPPLATATELEAARDVAARKAPPKRSTRPRLRLVPLVASVFRTTTYAVAKTAVASAILLAFMLVALFARDLPGHDTLANYKPAEITRIYSADGSILDEFATERRIFVPIEDIPERVQQAFISAEDKNFFTHKGFDLRAIAIAFVDAFRTGGEDMRGASTITQQVLKNFLLADAPMIERKIKELILANRIEQALSKEKILEIYLNEIFLGQNSYGVAAAARTYFNKPLDALSLREAAVLAALPKAPSDLHPVDDMTRLRARRNYVLREMYENGFISRTSYESEIWEPIETVQAGDIEGFEAELPPRDYFTDEIRRQFSLEHGAEAFLSSGWRLEASVDAEMQQAAARALRKKLEEFDRRQGIWRPTGLVIDEAELASEEKWRSALAARGIARDITLDGPWRPAVVLAFANGRARLGIEGVTETPEGHWTGASDPSFKRRMQENGRPGPWAGTMSALLRVGEVVHVRALEDGRGNFAGWSLRQVPEIQGAFMAMDVRTGHVIAMQGGFSYQHSPFNRATQALRQPGSAFKPFIYAAALERGYRPTTLVSDSPIEIETPDGIWRPQNSSGTFLGQATLRTGLQLSRNLMAVRLAQDLGLAQVAEMAERMGAYDRMDMHYANVLGAQETTLTRMLGAYAIIANGGRAVAPGLVNAVLEGSDDPRLARHLAKHGTSSRSQDADQVLDPVVAYQLTSMMRGVVDHGTASGAISLPVPAAGKTGTTNDSRDVWFVGFTSNIVAGCYIGYDQPRPLGPGAYGGTMCAPVFQDFMVEAVEKYGGGEFDVPPGGYFARVGGQEEFFRDGERPYDGAYAVMPDTWATGQDELLTRGNWYDPSVVEVPAGQYQTPNQTQSRSSPGASQVPVPSRSSTR